MEYVITATGTIVDFQGLIAAFPTIYIPNNPTPEFLTSIGAAPLVDVQPTVTAFQVATRTGAAPINGVWTATYSIGTMDATSAATKLKNLQDSMWALISNARDNAMLAQGVPVPVLVNGVLVTKGFLTDVLNRSRYTVIQNMASALTLAGQPATTALTTPNGMPLLWKTMDNSFVPLTIQIINDVVAAIANQEANAFANAEALNAAMLALPDPSNFDYSTGWPVVYTPIAMASE